MIFDLRTYVCKPGTMARHLAIYKQFGLEPQKRCLGEPVLYGVTETGDVNSYVHVWAYKDAGDRERRRAALWEDPDWLAYVAKSAEADCLLSQNNTLLKATDFARLPDLG